MGIPRLWEIVDRAADMRSLLNLATIHGFKVNNRKLRGLIIGVDISIRINAITAVLRAGGVFNPTPKLVLEKLFYQFCNFLLAPIIFVFVFDGPGRPSVKRGTRVVFRETDSKFYQDLKSMIVAFGFYYYEAPGEAEAELAQLNANDQIDAIITEDSDSLVFGARCVIRTQGSSVQHHCLVYSLDAIENTDGVSLDKDAIFLCALLLGGDYDPGISGVGPRIAKALATCGFGQKLVKILTSHAGLALDEHLRSWRNDLRKELAENRSGMLDACHPKLAETISTTFPSIRVVELYLHPLTSKSPHFFGSPPNVASWKPKQPNITSLSSFCSSTFGWHGGNLLNKLTSSLWPGAAFKLISSPLVLHNADAGSFTAPYEWSNPARLRLATKVVVLKMFRLHNYHPMFADSRTLNIHRVRVSTSNFVLLAGLEALPIIDCKLISIPEVVLAVAMRDPSSRASTSLTLSASCLIPHDLKEGQTRTNEEDTVLRMFESDEDDLNNAHGTLAMEGIID